MKVQLADRLAAMLSLLLLAGLAAGSWFLADLSSRMAAGPTERNLRHEPDYFVENVVFTRLNEQGAPAFRVSADVMHHFPDDDSVEYTRPVVLSLESGKPRVQIVADTGTTTSGGVETHLHGNVVLRREADGVDPPMVVTTDYAVIYSDTEIARTHRPVRIERDGSTLTGVGMEFNNAARSLTVDSEVRGTWIQAPKS